MFTFVLKDLDGKEIEFVARFMFPSKKRKQKNRRKVSCDVFLAKENILVSSGSSIKNDLDHYIRYEGRKWALTHAIKDFSKDERSSIWKQFFKQFPRTIYVIKKVKVDE